MKVAVSEVEAVLFRVRYVPTAEIARDRLREVIRSDRASCGDGRWVKAPPYKHGLPTPISIVANLSYWRFDDYRQRWVRRIDVDRPVYRWEPRR